MMNNNIEISVLISELNNSANFKKSKEIIKKLLELLSSGEWSPSQEEITRLISIALENDQVQGTLTYKIPSIFFKNILDLNQTDGEIFDRVRELIRLETPKEKKELISQLKKSESFEQTHAIIDELKSHSFTKEEINKLFYIKNSNLQVKGLYDKKSFDVLKFFQNLEK